MNDKRKRATANLKMLEFVAQRLGQLNDEVVYVGGCTTALLINDPLSLDVRPTLDVDCIVDVVSLGQYYVFEEKLKAKGFYRSMSDEVICRWHCDDIILDVMPTNENILGWGNGWYQEAIQNKLNYQLNDDLWVTSLTVPYFLATKIEAFKSRGNSDFFGSHDLEDIIVVIAGCTNVVDEINKANDRLKKHLRLFFNELLESDPFIQSLPGYLSDGIITMQRVQAVIEAMRAISY